MRALLIDDSKITRNIVCGMLRKLGFDVVEATDGLEALEHLRDAGGIDLALVDWNMPRMDGIRFVQAVRANRAYDALPLMMVTTESDREHIVTALEAGANEYMMKPFTQDVLSQKLALLGVASS